MRWVAWVLGVGIVVASCGPKKMIRELSLEHEGLRITLRISPDKSKPSAINGRLHVVNSSSRMVAYGNYRLFLEADGKQVVTSVLTKQATAHVDSRPVHLSPGDSLDFFVTWDFGRKIDFSNAVFKLHYIDTVGVVSSESKG